MQTNTARRSQENSVSHESESFQDLDCGSIEKDRASDQSLVSLENKKTLQKAVQTQNRETETINYHEEVTAYLKRQNQKLKKQNKTLSQKVNYSENQIARLQRQFMELELQNLKLTQQLQKISQSNSQLKVSLKQEKQLSQKTSKALQLSLIADEKRNSLQIKIQCLEQTISYFEKSDKQIRSFLRQQMQFNENKTTKSIVESIFSQMSSNRMEIAQQIGELLNIVGQQKKQNQQQKYNHWKQMQRLQVIAQFIIKNKNLINSQKTTIQSLNNRIITAQQVIRNSRKQVNLKKKQQSI